MSDNGIDSESISKTATESDSTNDLTGIELGERIKKGQFKTGKLGECNATMTELGCTRSLRPQFAIR